MQYLICAPHLFPIHMSFQRQIPPYPPAQTVVAGLNGSELKGNSIEVDVFLGCNYSVG